MSSRAFFPYHPRGWRLRLAFAMACTVVLLAWAVAGVVASGAVLEVMRVGASVGLLAALFTVWLRLRPRPGWGVTVGPLSLGVSRALGGQTELLWVDVEQARWVDAERRGFVVLASEGETLRQVLLARHLFPSKDEFEAVVRAIELARLQAGPRP